MSNAQQEPSGKLHRRLGLVALVFYGVGDILGAGIYALVGEVAAIAGDYSWLAFLIALLVAGLTGLTYAELGGRFARSGGESHFCQQAFSSPWIARLIGWLVFCSGVLSLSTISRAFAGYLQALVPDISPEICVVLLLLLLAAINIVGIRVSSVANIFCTVVEASGLLLVICVGLAYLIGEAPEVVNVAPAARSEPVGVLKLLQASSLAFFAFIGFEDMVNVAEEATDPRRDMPRAILLAASTAGLLYIVVVVVATQVVEPDHLQNSSAPLLAVVNTAAPWVPGWLFTAIALFAVANTGLLNFVTASRLLYGMSQDGLLPKCLSAVHHRRGTPHWAVLVVLVTGILLATSGTIGYLAGTTSVLLLCVFVTMNVALIRLKQQRRRAPESFTVPVAIPVAGAAVCLGLLLTTPRQEALTAALIIIVGILLAWQGRRRSGDAAR